MTQGGVSDGAAAAANGTSIACHDSNNAHLPPRGDAHKVKTFQMMVQLDADTPFYEPYDPVVGLRIAAVLAGFLAFIIVYALYKTKCRRERWTPDDKQFIEHYSRKLTDKWTGKAPRRQNLNVRQATARNTANWIQSQPLNETFEETGKFGIDGAVYRACFDAACVSAFPVCAANAPVSDVTTVSLPHNLATNCTYTAVNLVPGAIKPIALNAPGASGGVSPVTRVNTHRLPHMGLSLDTTLGGSAGRLTSASLLQQQRSRLDDTESLGGSYGTDSITLPGVSSHRVTHTITDVCDDAIPQTVSEHVIAVPPQRSPGAVTVPTVSAFTAYGAPQYRGGDTPQHRGGDAPQHRGGDVPQYRGGDAPQYRGSDAPQYRGSDVLQYRGSNVSPVLYSNEPNLDIGGSQLKASNNY